MIEKFSREVDAYLELVETRPDLFPVQDKVVTDRKTMIEFAQRRQKPVGVAYESPWHYLLVDVLNADAGGLMAYERFVHRSEGTAAVIVPLFPDNTIGMLKHYRHTLGRMVYELPRGYSEDDEIGMATAIRELMEEFGSEAIDLKHVGYVVADSGVSGDVVEIVACSIENSNVNIDHEGIQGAVKMTPAGFRKSIREGKITDGFTLSAYAIMEAKGFFK